MNYSAQTQKILDQNLSKFMNEDFISSDPISIPYQFSIKQDIEISAFFASIFAWGQRKTIINSTRKLMNLMGNSPYDFVLNHSSHDLKKMVNFKHRTFNGDDLLYFISFFKHHYSNNKSLESAFAPDVNKTMEEMLIHFYHYFFSLEHLPRTHKHIASPHKKSACKRLNMFMRWMVRTSPDFGIWNQISTSQLLMPLDVHVQRVALEMGLLKRTQSDWQAVMELTNNLKKYDRIDPVKYDYAIFGLGIE